MGFFKVILWIFLIILGLIVLTSLFLLLLSSIRVRVGVDYTEDDGTKFRLGYGFLNFSFGGKKKKPKDPPKEKKKKKKSALTDKAKAKGREILQKKQFEHEIKQQEDLALEKERIDKEETRLNAEMEHADQDIQAAESAEKSGTPLPDVVDEGKVSKLKQIQKKIDSWDIEGAINLGKSFMDGFSFQSILALMQFIKDQTKESISKVAKRFTINDISVRLFIHGKDAANTALKYGECASVVFSAMSLLVSYGKVRKYDVDLVPDFLGTKNRAEFHNTVAFTPIRVLSPVLFSGLKIGKRTLKEADAGLTKMDKTYTKLKEERGNKLLDQTAEQLGYTTKNG